MKTEKCDIRKRQLEEGKQTKQKKRRIEIETVNMSTRVTSQKVSALVI